VIAEEYALYGYSLFETLLAKKGCFWRLDQHHARLAASAQAFDLEPPDRQTFFRNIARVHDPNGNEVLRYTLFKDGGRWCSEPSSTQTAVLKTRYPGRSLNPLRLCLADDPLPADDPLRCHKSGSRIQYQLHGSRAQARGWNDCLFVDTRNRFLEASTYSLYFLLGGEWLTPAKKLGVLPGIGRGWLLERGLVREAPIGLADLARISAMAASNSVVGLVPVSCLDNRSLAVKDALELQNRVGERTYLPLPTQA